MPVLFEAVLSGIPISLQIADCPLLAVAAAQDFAAAHGAPAKAAGSGDGDRQKNWPGPRREASEGGWGAISETAWDRANADVQQYTRQLGALLPGLWQIREFCFQLLQPCEWSGMRQAGQDAAAPVAETVQQRLRAAAIGVI
jgi:hypothetical protein